MKRRKVIIGELADAINAFLKELPDPEKTELSTFKDEFILNNRKISFQAQKKKGPQGMWWNIDYQS